MVRGISVDRVGLLGVCGLKCVQVIVISCSFSERFRKIYSAGQKIITNLLKAFCYYASHQASVFCASSVRQNVEFFSPLKTKQICSGVISVSVYDNENNLIFRYVHGLYAFGLEECGEYGPASDHARLALEVNPGDAWAAHAQAHCYEVSVVLTSFF